MIALVVVLGALVVIGLLPVGCRACLGDEMCIQVVVGPLRFAVFPGKKQPKRKKNVTLETKPKQQSPERPKLSLTDAKRLLPMFRTFLETLDAFRRSVTVRLLRLHVTFGGGDPTELGLRYGQAWAIIGTLTPLIERVVRIKERDISPIYDPEANGFLLEAEACATLRVWQILWIALRYGLRALRQLLQMKKQKGGVNHESSPS